MATKKSTPPAEARRRERAARERTAATARLLNERLDAIDTPAEWTGALDAAARLGRLTFANAVLATTQRPDAVYLRSYDDWLAHGRQVQKGEKGVRILVPKTAAVHGLAGDDGPARIDGVDTTVVFDVAQTEPADTGAGPGPAAFGPARYSEQEILRVIGTTPAGRTTPGAAHADAAALIRSRVSDDLERLDPAIAHEVATCAEHMVRGELGLATGDAAGRLIGQWEHLPVSDRRRRMIDVGNHAALRARPLIGVMHVHGVEQRAGRPAGTEHAAGPASRGTEAQAPRTSVRDMAEEAMAAEGTDPSDPAVLAAANADAWTYFQQRAASSPVIGEYLVGRGIVAADELPVGYAPPDARLGAYLRRLGYSDEVQVAAGLSRRLDNGRVADVFRDRALAAITDTDGRIAGFTGRALHDKGPKYLNTSATPLFDKSSLLYGLTPAAAERLEAGALPVVMEGPMDVLAIAGYHPDGLVPLATCGTAFGEGHRAVLEDMLPTARLHLAYDNDAAGTDATLRVGERLAEQGWRVTSPPPRPGMDPADVAATDGSKVLDWIGPRRARPVIYTAVETQMTRQRDDHPDIDKATLGARVIDHLETHWGADTELAEAVGYVGMRTGVHRPAGANRRGRTGRAYYAYRAGAVKAAVTRQTTPTAGGPPRAAAGPLADTRQTPAWRATNRAGGPGRGLGR